MTERNPYSQQFNYDSYDQTAPLRRREEPLTFRERMSMRLSSPVFATVALLLTAAAFAGIIVASYPSSENTTDVPVIQASAGDMHGQPPENGGLAVPDQDTTVYNNIHSSDMKESAPVEDLLAQEKPIDKLEAFAKEAESMYDEQPKAIKNSVAHTADAGEAADESADESTDEPTEISENSDVTTPTDAANDNTTPKVIKIQQQEERIPPSVDGAATATDTAAAGQIKQPAGSAPETLAFVKSVLNEKDGKSAGKAPAQQQAVNTQAAATESPALQKIEPASGAAATAASAVITGSYYVQLGSVMSEDGASTEWKRLQKSYGSALQGAQYRVQKADLGEGRIRYRIQAGPMNKENASSVCGSIKAQKPGACIVVQ